MSAGCIHALEVSLRMFVGLLLKHISLISSWYHSWGMTFQNVYVNSVYIAFNCTAHGGSTGQGTGSLSIIDSHFNHVPYAITVSAEGPAPNIVLDNLRWLFAMLHIQVTS